MTRRFPDGFRWGAATASYQIEGAVGQDGRGPSIWDTFSHTPGRVTGGDTGDIACDHYHRVGEDVELMAKLGLQDYRFSIAWPRVQPAGSGAVNPAGLDFYARLVDDLLAHDIRPVATLYHWDLPQPLDDAGGWTARDTAERFAEYAAVVGERLGDRVPLFTTLNEPWCSAYLGYATGEHAPGHQDRGEAFTAAFHLLLAHGLGVAALRSVLPGDAHVSITLNPAQVYAASGSEADRAAADRADLVANRLFLDPLLRGHLPAGLAQATASDTDWSFVRDGDLATVAAPIDLLGVNYYTPAVVAARPDPAEPLLFAGTSDVWVQRARPPATAMGWNVHPDSFVTLLTRIARDYPGTPLAITENGAAYDDVVGDDGEVHDDERARYVVEHIGAVHRAIEQGVDVRAYYVWSLLDNFEWAWGYSQRFGIVHVDFATQERRLKHSAHVYRDIVAANALP